MTEHRMDDDMDEVAPLDGAAGEAARAYHASDAPVPREAMWAAIAARRAAASTVEPAAPALRVVAGGAPAASEATARDVPRAFAPPRWAYAIAATMLLVIGVGIGRQMRGSIVAQREARADSVTSAAVWQAASTEHFGQVETLLTWMTSSPEARSEAQLAAWSRDLLGSTRLKLAKRISGERAEDLNRAATRLWNTLECLKKAGLSPEAPLVLDSTSPDGWMSVPAGMPSVQTQEPRSNP
ncbi:MAG: hypothetical protein HY275_05640 [Gemmatimonadetes bacterium]|nr:hypothetical protein [Gemmatimonadota bacterium]